MTANGTVSQATGRNTYLLNVDYGMSIEAAVRLGLYDWASEDINFSNFPTEKTGRTAETIELVHFNRLVSSDDVLQEIDKMGMRPAELHELLAFGEKYPDIQKAFPIVALGSVWQGWHGRRYVPCLSGHDSGRYLRLGWIEDDWGGFYRFAAVRKV